MKFERKITVANPKLKAKNIFFRFWYWIFKPKPELELEVYGEVHDLYSRVGSLWSPKYLDKTEYSKKMSDRSKARRAEINKR